MKIHRAWFCALALPFLVTTAEAQVGGTAAAAAVATPVDGSVSSVSLLIKGDVVGLPENISVSGKVAIESTIALDPIFLTPPTVLLRIRFVNVTGKGVSTGRIYTTGANEGQIIRPLPAVPTVTDDFITVTFPLWDSASGMLSARQGVASLALKYSKNSGDLAGGTASVSTPPSPGF